MSLIARADNFTLGVLPLLLGPSMKDELNATAILVIVNELR
jgi:hypothetical protein